MDKSVKNNEDRRREYELSLEEFNIDSDDVHSMQVCTYTHVYTYPCMYISYMYIYTYEEFNTDSDDVLFVQVWG
jgi:hypothetical protein